MTVTQNGVVVIASNISRNIKKFEKKGNEKKWALPILEERFHPARRLNGPTSTRGAVQTVPTCMNLMFVYKHKCGRNNHAIKKKTRGSATEF